MAQDVVINGTTYPAVESVVLTDTNGNTKQYYPDAVRYVAQTLTAAQQAQARANIGAVAKNGLTLGIHTDGLLYLFVDGVPVGAGIEMPEGGDVVGYVDSANNIVVKGNLPDGTYSVKYEMENGTVVNIGNMVLDSNVYYSVTNTLTNCTSNNSATKAIEGNGYSATISAKSGYELSSVKVTMGGTDISSTAVSGGKITIANVTGNIVITAVAVVAKPAYTNLLPLAVDASGNDYKGTNGEDGYKSGYKISTSSGNESAASGACVSGFIPINGGTKIRIKNITLSSTASINNLVFYDASKTKKNGYAGTAGAFTSAVTVKNGVYEVNLSAWYNSESLPAFFRFSCGTITSETIVTVDEEIV